MARKWNVDYAFYKTGPDKYLLFFKSWAGRCHHRLFFGIFPARVLNASKSRRVPIREQLKQAAAATGPPAVPRAKERAREAVHADR